MSKDLNDIFSTAAPDYKIWHGIPRKEDMCPTSILDRPCDFEEIALWDDRLEELATSLEKTTEANSLIESVYIKEIELLVAAINNKQTLDDLTYVAVNGKTVLDIEGLDESSMDFLQVVETNEELDFDDLDFGSFDAVGDDQVDRADEVDTRD